MSIHSFVRYIKLLLRGLMACPPRVSRGVFHVYRLFTGDEDISVYAPSPIVTWS